MSIHSLLAAAITIPNDATPSPGTIDSTVPIVHSSGVTTATTYDTLIKIGTNTLNIIVYIAGAVLIGSVIVHSISLMASKGNEAQVTTAKKGLTNAALGIVVVVGAFVIINLIMRFVLSN